MAMHCSVGGTSVSPANPSITHSQDSYANNKDEIKTQFVAREGPYKLMNSPEYSRPNRIGYNPAGQTNTPVRVSFANSLDPNGSGDRICFNVGRELYIYTYKGVKKETDLSKPLDKRVYKGTYPTCHDFNPNSVSGDGTTLLVGFSAGQIQLIDPTKKESSKLYNEERLIDKTKVTNLKWVPNSSNLFLVSHSSGQLYLYKEDLPCGSTPPNYQIFKQGDGYAIYTCKTKSTRNPLYRWVVGDGAINEFSFSPCCKYLATVSQDGFLRVFNYDTMELIGRIRSYFGGLLCVAWSPDSKYIVTGGEDDLVTVWSFAEKRVVARGQGHKSWVSVVAFDPFTTSYGDFVDLSGSDEELNAQQRELGQRSESLNKSNSVCDAVMNRSNSKSNSSPMNITSYRFGSVGQDTQLCLWDLSDDILKQPVGRSRTSILLHSPSAQLSSIGLTNTTGNSNKMNSATVNSNCYSNNTALLADGNLSLNANNSSNCAKNASDPKKEHKRNFSLASRNSDKNSVNKASHSKLVDDPVRLLGTPVCPRLDDLTILEPLVCKKIAHERLTSLVFREDCFVTACQEGYVCTWARPGKWGTGTQLISSPSPSLRGEIDLNDDSGVSTVV